MTRCIMLATLIGIGSCTTPDLWRPEDHQKMMIRCKLMCGKYCVKSYEPITGECNCYKSLKETKNVE